jgi:YVTN family beta-propeller protein
VLGPLEVLRAGRAVPLGGPRQRAVLALLLVEANRFVSMDRLAEDLWGGRPPVGWANTLQTYVFHLRQALEPDRPPGAAGGVLVTSGRGYLLRVNREHLDASLFQDGFTAGRAALEAGRYAEAAATLGRALELWRGPVLADLADYAFTRPEAARLEELRLAALEARIDADLALGRHDALTAELEQLAGEHPLRERLHGQLMLALYRCGRQAEALAAYRRARDLLTGELGIDPAEPLQRLHASVLAHDPALDWRPGSQAPILAPAPGAAAAKPASPPPEGPGPRSVEAREGLVRGPSHARRLLVLGAALAVVAVAAIVGVARPWAVQQASLPASSVGLIDSGGGRVGAPVTIGSPAGLAYGGGSVWAVDSTDGTLFRINPATHAVVAPIPVGFEPTAVTITRGGNVWVANSGDGTVSRINAAANKVVDTITVGNVPVAIASGPSGVWVANRADGTVYRIDPGTGLVTMKKQVGLAPDGIAVGRNAVWVANGGDGTVSRIDPRTGDVSGPSHVGAGPEGIAVTPTAVWVANSLDLTVSRLDPATGTVTGTIPVGDGPHAIAASKDAVWVSDEFGAQLVRIDLRTGQVRKIFLGTSPQGLALAGSGVWVAARPFTAASHRGGTLTVVTQWLPARDPALAYGSADLPALATAYDGLVALRRSGGAQGLTLVPDLATRLPPPTDGGKTYTFTLRRGIHYSNGALVRASDFRRGIQRLLTIGGPITYYDGILGAPACHQHPRRCDLSAGIVTSDAAGTVTVHLAQADPDFPYKLALLFAVPAPPGAPSRVIDRAPFLPGTGPYMISQYRPGVSFTLVRNPYFRQWSYAAQPAGYPDVIYFKRMADPGAQIAAVTAGTADLAGIGGNAQASRDLGVRYPTRVHSGLKVRTTYVFLNTRQPPFSNLKARQAVSYAIDRARVLHLLHLAPGQAVVTCQILPADFPGHQPYCPYTTGANNGVWHGPDLPKATRLAQQSHTTGVPVTVWNVHGSNIGAYLVQLLGNLGYRATLHTVSGGQYFTAVGDSRRKVQIGLHTWIADFPAPSTFLSPVLSCQSFNQNPISSFNYAEYCNPTVDMLAGQAQADQLTDPAAARRLWARVDRVVTRAAPWVPVADESSTVFVSARVGNYQESPVYGPLLDQIRVH